MEEGVKMDCGGERREAIELKGMGVCEFKVSLESLNLFGEDNTDMKMGVLERFCLNQ
jgi:hypothetical protein